MIASRAAVRGYPSERGSNYTPVEPVRCALPGASCGKQMIARSVPAPVNHHRGSYTSPALAAASYPFVDLPPGNTLRCKLFPSSKFTIHLFPKEAGHSIIKLTTDRFLCGCQRILTHIISDVKAIW